VPLGGGRIRHWFGDTSTADVQTSSLGATSTLVSLSVPTGLKVDAVVSAMMSTGTPPASVMISSPDAADLAPTTTTLPNAVPGYTLLFNTATGNVNSSPGGTIQTNTAGQIRLRASQANTSLDVYTRGYEACLPCNYSTVGSIQLDGLGLSPLTTTTTAAVTLSTAVGNEYVEALVLGNTTTTISDTAGLTYTLRKHYNGGAGIIEEWISNLTTGALTNDTISLTFTTSSIGTEIYAFSVAGANTTTGFDPNSAVPATVALACCGHPNISTTYSTTKAKDLVINATWGFNGTGVPAPTISTGFSQLFPPVTFNANFGTFFIATSFGYVSSPQSGATPTYSFTTNNFNYGSMLTDAFQASGQ
jgi:hypothetical protein